jgi:hypothetical protein
MAGVAAHTTVIALFAVTSVEMHMAVIVRVVVVCVIVTCMASAAVMMATAVMATMR